MDMINAIRVNKIVLLSKRIAFFGIILLILSCFCYLGVKIKNFIDTTQLLSINIKGNLTYQSSEQIYSMLLQYNNESFYNINLENIKNNLLRLPWIKKVYIQRKWPAKLEIKLTEKIPFALFGNEGVISCDNKVFYPSNIPEIFPKIFGNINLLNEILNKYRIANSFIKSVNLQIQEFELMPDQGYRILVSPNLTSLNSKQNSQFNLFLGSKELEDRLKNFVVAYESKFIGKENSISYIDLRYTNGLALKYKVSN